MEVARAIHPRRAVAGAVPIRLETALTGERRMLPAGRGATQGRRSALGIGRSASWRRTAPTSAGGRQAQMCGGSSADGRAGRSAC